MGWDGLGGILGLRVAGEFGTGWRGQSQVSSLKSQVSSLKSQVSSFQDESGRNVNQWDWDWDVVLRQEHGFGVEWDVGWVGTPPLPREIEILRFPRFYLRIRSGLVETAGLAVRCEKLGLGLGFGYLDQSQEAAVLGLEKRWASIYMGVGRCRGGGAEWEAARHGGYIAQVHCRAGAKSDNVPGF